MASQKGLSYTLTSKTLSKGVILLGLVYALAFPNPLGWQYYPLGPLALLGVLLVSWRIFFMSSAELVAYGLLDATALVDGNELLSCTELVGGIAPIRVRGNEFLYVSSIRKISKAKLWFSIRLGFFFGGALALLFAWWMLSYYAPSIVFGMAITGLSYSPMFLALWLGLVAARRMSSRYGVVALVQSLVWVGFEYSRTLGVFANPLGISGYLFAAFPEWIQLADIAGVWGLSFVGIFPLALLAELIAGAYVEDGTSKERAILRAGFAESVASVGCVGSVDRVALVEQLNLGEAKAQGTRFVYRVALFLMLSVLCIVSVLAYGAYRLSEHRAYEGVIRVGAVQQDPHDDTARDTEKLLSLSRSLAQTELAVDLPDFIVWPETAIEFPLTGASDEELAHLSKEGRAAVAAAQAYLDAIEVPHLVGAYSGGKTYRNNAALSYLPREMGGLDAPISTSMSPISPIREWHKSKLVPFIEYNPVPWLLEGVLLPRGFGRVLRGELSEPLIVRIATPSDKYEQRDREQRNQGDAGSTRDLRDAGGKSTRREQRDDKCELRDLRVSTPICFEECFGSLVRGHAKKGAQFIIAMANDSWAGGDYAAWQQCYTGLVRAVETRLPMLRVCSSGITCLISDRGELIDMIDAEKPGTAIFELSVAKPLIERGETIYMRYGDWLGIGCFLFMLLLVIVTLVRVFVPKS